MSDSLWPHWLSWNSPVQNTGVGSLSHFQGIFPTQGSNPGVPNYRHILYQLSHKGNPGTLQYVVYPFSSEISWPRKWTEVSCIAGGFFTSWATREAHKPESNTMLRRSGAQTGTQESWGGTHSLKKVTLGVGWLAAESLPRGQSALMACPFVIKNYASGAINLWKFSQLDPWGQWLQVHVGSCDMFCDHPWRWGHAGDSRGGEIIGLLMHSTAALLLGNGRPQRARSPTWSFIPDSELARPLLWWLNLPAQVWAHYPLCVP